MNPLDLTNLTCYTVFWPQPQQKLNISAAVGNEIALIDEAMNRIKTELLGYNPANRSELENLIVRMLIQVRRGNQNPEVQRELDAMVERYIAQYEKTNE